MLFLQHQRTLYITTKNIYVAKEKTKCIWRMMGCPGGSKTRSINQSCNTGIKTTECGTDKWENRGKSWKQHICYMLCGEIEMKMNMNIARILKDDAAHAHAASAKNFYCRVRLNTFSHFLLVKVEIEPQIILLPPNNCVCCAHW